MSRFTNQNTEGYTDAELAELNRRYDAAIANVEFDASEIGEAAERREITHRVWQAYEAEQSAVARGLRSRLVTVRRMIAGLCAQTQGSQESLLREESRLLRELSRFDLAA